MLLALAGSLLVIAQAALFSQVVAGVFLRGQSLTQVTPALSLLLGALTLRAVLVWAVESAASALAARVKTRLRLRLLDRLLHAGPAAIQEEQTGELVQTLGEGIESLEAYLSQYLPQWVLASGTPLLILAFVFPADPLSGVILLLTAPLIPVFMLLIGSLGEQATRRQWQSLSRMSAYFLDVLQGLTTLKMLGRSREQGKIITAVSERFRQVTMGVLRITFLSSLALELIATLSTAVIAVQIGLRLLYGSLEFEPAFFILVLAPEFYLPLRQLGLRFHAAMSGTQAANRLYALEDKIERQVAERSRSDAELDPSGLRLRSDPIRQDAERSRSAIERPSTTLRDTSPFTGITFDQVAFAYPGREPLLEDISCHLPAGQMTALVGASGGGKSTLASLLLGFLTPIRGEIYFQDAEHSRSGVERSRNGAGLNPKGLRLHSDPIRQDVERSRNTAELDPKGLRLRSDSISIPPIAWVPQTPHLFHGTILENIRLGLPEAPLEAVQEAARLGHAHDFIQALPQGYETLIGEGGAGLSGGQAQRIALARAFLLDAPILVLDEPTAHLDPESEALLAEACASLARGRTVLVIAHRQSTVRRADQILVLDQGRICCQGTHMQLSQTCPRYQALIADPDGQEDSPGAPLQLLRTHPLARAAAIPVPPGVLRQASASANPPEPAPARNVRTLLRLLGFLKPFSGWILLSVLLGFATVGSSVGLMTASAYILAKAALRPSIAELQVAIVAVRFFGLSRGIFRYLERLISHRVTFQVLARLRAWFYAALEPLAPARLQMQRSGDLLGSIVSDINTLENFYVRAVAPPLIALATLLAASAGMVAFASAPGLLLLAFLVFSGLSLPWLSGRLSRIPGRQVVAARAELHIHLVDALQGLADITAYGQVQRWLARLGTASQELVQAQRRLGNVSGLHAAWGSWLAHLGMWSVLVAGSALVQQGQLEGVYLGALCLAALTSFEAVLPLTAQHLSASLSAGERLLAVVDCPPAVQEPPDPLPLPADLTLQADRLSFWYPQEAWREPSDLPGRQAEASGPVYALFNVSFSLPPGKRLALVGSSGAGKSTLAHLLLRFWEDPGQELTLAGLPLRRYASMDIRSLFSLVSQHTYLFSATIWDNLRLACPEASQDDIIAAARQAQIHEFIESLPQGYQTWIGEHGRLLSGGERQRLGVARALLRQAPILILDEPTAHLDAPNAQSLWANLLALTCGRASLIITHQLNGLEAMDEILVLDRGQVVERGRHAELLERGGLYQHMWKVQNQRTTETLKMMRH